MAPVRITMAVLVMALACAAHPRAADYVIDPSHSRITFTVTKWGLVEVQAVVTRFDGTISWDPAAPASATTTWSARVDSIDSGEPKRDASLLDPEYLDAQRHPALTFRSTRATRVDASTLLLDGMITIRGVTKPITTRVVLNGERDVPHEGRVAVFDATFTVNRRDFGVVGGRVLGPVISDDVRVRVTAVARRR